MYMVFIKKHLGFLTSVLNMNKFGFVVVVLIALGAFFAITSSSEISYSQSKESTMDILSLHQEQSTQLKERIEQIRLENMQAKHIQTPDRVRAIYMSSWIGSEKGLRSGLVEFMKNSSINSLVLDIKDYSGVISFDIDHPLIDEYGTDSNRIRDIEAFIEELHEHDIYVIGRLTVFQDPLLAKKKPEYAFKRKDNGEVWKDHKGLAFLNPQKKDVWEYLAVISEESYKIGFDEINFDYIRYPSDGNIANLNYALEAGQTRTSVMKSFYEFLDDRLRTQEIPISADLFGMTTTNQDDLSIGQDLEDALPHFDFIAPMVYPSHYPDGFLGYGNPADYPYEIVFHAMNEGRKRAEAIEEDPLKLRTWVQDFDLGASYDRAKIEAQIKATYDAGLNSYMVWDPKNSYTREAYKVDLWQETTL